MCVCVCVCITVRLFVKTQLIRATVLGQVMPKKLECRRREGEMSKL